MEDIYKSEYSLSDEEILMYYDRLLTQYNICLHSDGLDYQNYLEIKNIIKKLSLLKRKAYYSWSEYIRLHEYILNDEITSEEDKEYYITNRNNKREWLNEVEKLLTEYKKMMELLKSNIVPVTLKQYLQDNCSITHLLYANNTFSKIRSYSVDSFMFLCQFHLERTPSLGVSNGVGLGHCFACGTRFNVISYIMKYEKMSYGEAVCLLARVYLIDIGDNLFDEDNPLVIKYRNALLSDGFKQLLLSGYERTNEKEDSYAKEKAMQKYNHDLKTIDRVSNGEWLKYEKRKEVAKKLVLEMPEFSVDN